MKLIKAKIQHPITQKQIIQRSHLYGQLDEGLQRKITLVSAPAGYGKTTLVADWITTRSLEAAWLTLDTSENILIRFWLYFVKVLQLKYRRIGELLENQLTGLKTINQYDIEQTLINLVNEFAEIGSEFIIVLDDFQVISDRVILETVCFFLDYMPPQMHIVIMSRTIPSLPLAGYRTKNQVQELTTEHLRFSVEETRRFFAQTPGIKVSSNDIEVIHERVEGWVTGLQLARLSMTKESDISSVVRGLSGADYELSNYLFEEVFAYQTEKIQIFLLRTSILDRLSSDLCDAINFNTDSNEILQQLYRSGLFITPLDTKHSWYAYHQLFREFLLMRFHKLNDADLDASHIAAGEWFQDQGFVSEAIQHFSKASDFDRLAQMLEQNGDNLWSIQDYEQFRHYVSQIPSDILTNYPKLILYYCIALLDASQFEMAREYLSHFEKGLTLDGGRNKDLKGVFLYLKAALGSSDGQVETLITGYEDAYESLPSDSRMKITIKNSLGYAYASTGNLPAAFAAYDTASQLSRHLDQVEKAAISAFRAVIVRLRQGRLREAQRLIAGIKELVDDNQLTPHPSIAWFLVGNAIIALEHNNLEQVIQLAYEAYRMADKCADHTPIKMRSRYILAHINRIVHKWDQSLNMLQKMVRDARGFNASPWRRGAFGEKALVYLGQGNVEIAGVIARNELGLLSVEDLNPAFTREYPILARVLLAERKEKEALDLLRQLHSMTYPNQLGLALEVQILLATTLMNIGLEREAVETIRPALMLGRTEGYLRTFLNDIDRLKDLLYVCKGANIETEYATRLLAVGEHESYGDQSVLIQTLVEPLTVSELEVLRLVSQGLSNQQDCRYTYCVN